MNDFLSDPSATLETVKQAVAEVQQKMGFYLCF
jgi:hypothetical protein